MRKARGGSRGANKVRDWDAEREAATIRMATDPNTWPLWPALPLKKYGKGGEFPTLGYLLDGGPLVPDDPRILLKVRQGIVYAPKGSDPVVGEYATAEEMVAAGWLVD